MIEILGLIGAIVLIVQVLQYRALLAFPFARQTFTRLDGPTEAAADPLFADVLAQAAELGFGVPTWVEAGRADGETELWPLRAVLRAPDGTGQLWLGPPSNSAYPHRLLTWFSHRLADGRTAISQPFDPYFELVQGPHLVARTAGQAELALQWQAHRAWVDGHGSAPVAIADADVVADTEAFNERVRQDLIASGQVRALDADVAVPRLAFARRIRRAIVAMPKPPEDKRPVPAPRLAHFATVIEAIQHRSPPRDTQWVLFAISVALFMGLGALLWDAAMAVYVLVVVLVHELGHFLAMRAFGYRNTHILALPLVGGVAMGHDVDPSATKRAWMSLMGPLPGIVIGWVLAVGHATGLVTGDWVLPLALVFLFVNYLNVLPMPPLDGAHVLEALLPARWARLQTILIGVLAIVGAAIALYFEFYVLAIIAVLQLPALVTGWRLHGVERLLVAQASIGLRPRGERIERILRALDDTLGPSANAKERVQQALTVLQRIDMKPMGVVSRLGTGGVYLALLVVPVAGVVAMGVLGSSAIVGGGEATEEDTHLLAEMEDSRVAQMTTARALPLPELLDALSTAPLPPPASAGALAAAEAKLGQPLPADLRALYAVANGVPELAVRPVEELAAPAAETITLLGYGGGTLYLEDGVEIDLADVRRWWQVGNDEEAPLFYLPAPHPKLGDARVVSAWLESPGTHRDVRAYLDMRWVEARESEEAERRFAAAARRASAKLAGQPVDALLASWDEPGFLLRWMNPDIAWPDPVDDAALEATGARLGRKLPAELEKVLRVHDGFPPLQLLPASAIQPWGDFTRPIDAETRGTWFAADTPYEYPFEGGAVIAPHTEAGIAHCLVVAGRRGRDGEYPMPPQPMLLWCPDGRPAAFVDPVYRRGFATLHEWMLPRAVHMGAVDEM